MFRIDVLYDKAKGGSEAVAVVIEEQLEPIRKAFPGYRISVKPDEKQAKAAKRFKTMIALCLGLVAWC